ncbi:MAG TPA: response regulator [Gallionella sp.]|nr:response regulator [Gallionella sp.]
MVSTAARELLPVRNVLLIEDDPSLTEWVKQAAADFDTRIELTVLPVGVAVLEWLGGVTRKRLPHIILLDLKLPKLDGLAVLRTLRSNVATRDTPIVVFSEEYIQADVVLGYQVGANSFIAKPATQEACAECLREQLSYWLQPRQRELALGAQ